MEVKINREIRKYTEAVFFGLSLRQFLFSLCAAGAAVLLYFLCRPSAGTELLSWICILGAAPFALLGFVHYHGMPAERLLVVLARYALSPRVFLFRGENLYRMLTEGRKTK